MVRNIAVFIKDRIGLPFGRPRVDLSEDLATYWLGLSLHVMRGNVDPTALIEIGDDNDHGSAGTTMTVQAILRTVQTGWGNWDSKTVAYWCHILEEATESLLAEETAPEPSLEALEVAPVTVEV